MPKNTDRSGSQILQNPPRVAVVAGDGVDEYPLADSLRVFGDAGCRITLIGPREGVVQSWLADGPGHNFVVESTPDAVQPEDFHVLFVPGTAPRREGLLHDMSGFVGRFAALGRPVGGVGNARIVLEASESLGREDVEVEGNVAFAEAPRGARNAALATLALARERQAAEAA